mmetsp:Transcript_21850/g.54029  ORF Transcript_21850/g.54029 Transcript_21850/m.54029 type:complete len:168 (-) Transcript_21850:65-568(-)
MTDIRIENQQIDQLQTSSPSFDEDKMSLDNADEVLKPTTNSFQSEKTMSIESEKTMSMEEDEAREAQSKSSVPLDNNELTPNTVSTTKSLKDTSKSLADAPPVIDLTDYAEDEGVTGQKNDDEKSKEAHRENDDDDEKGNEKKTESAQPSEPKNANEASQKPKRKSE